MFSIFSVFRPHFRHLNSYRGTEILLKLARDGRVYHAHRNRFPARARLLVMPKKRAANNSREQSPPAPSNGAAPGGGCLYVVGTPIGNLEDITLRALRILKEADLIACEDTRHTQKLLDHYQIRKPLVSYHEHNEASRAEELVEKAAGGGVIAVVSDAGMPRISDAGYRL